MAIELLPFDPAEHLTSQEAILYYLEAAMEGNDPRHIARALGDVARSKGDERDRQKDRPRAAGALYCALG